MDAKTLAAAPLLALTLAACPTTPAAPPSSEQAAPVDKAVRDLYTGYTTAATGDQARTALEDNGAAAFVEALKTKAKACSAAAEAGKPNPTCDVDPVVCTTAHPTLTTVVVQTISGTAATATAVVTPDGTAPINVRVSLTKDGGAWKVASVECPR